MSPVDMYVGNSFRNLKGEVAKILEYVNSKNVIVQFEDGTVVNVIPVNLRSGEFKNRNTPCFYGVGYLGYGEFSGYEKGNKMTKAYQLWAGMLERCYSPNQERDNPTYKNCKVDDKWHNFQNFARWYYSQPIIENAHLDKDILSGNQKLYSEATCVLIPASINSVMKGDQKKTTEFPQGIRETKSHSYEARYKNQQLGTFKTVTEAQKAYNEAKEIHIRNLAETYKDVLPVNIYKKLANYHLE